MVLDIWGFSAPRGFLLVSYDHQSQMADVLFRCRTQTVSRTKTYFRTCDPPRASFSRDTHSPVDLLSGSKRVSFQAWALRFQKVTSYILVFLNDDGKTDLNVRFTVAT